VNGVYVALGSSMAAGPGIKPRVPGSPRRAGRSTRNYAGLVAAALHIDLIDVTYSGATTAHILRDRQNGAPPQIEALDGPGARTVLVPAAAASRGHHAWSAEPWTVGARRGARRTGCFDAGHRRGRAFAGAAGNSVLRRLPDAASATG